MAEDTEAMRMALKALDVANQALHNGITHEQVCSERYKGINDRLSCMPDMISSINSIKASVDKGQGGLKAMHFLVLLLSGLATFLVILEKL